ncbi:MAG: DHH family phosphoesterase [Desulfobacterales bacterium]|jgi:nanoRNase/pAp phosphatase (c-di-AMP/oligoRNAs hydrolase)
MPKSASERLRRFYDQFSNNDAVLIVINADPDAIASAMAVSRLLWHKVATTTIGHVNEIKRPDNLAMIRLLGIKLTHIDQINREHHQRVVMVDSQPKHHPVLETFAPQVIIDHHPDTGVQAPFLDIRPKYGATASIMTEYLRAAKIKPSVKLATGLFHAIKTDTCDFERHTLLEDVRAFQFLFRHANIYIARKIEQAEIRLDFLKFYKIALQNMILRSGRVFAHLGTVPASDVCVLIADFFMRVNGVNWSIVSGVFERKLIVILRNDGIRKNAGTVAAKGFGQIGSAGGHKSTARAEIDLDALKNQVDVKNERKLVQWIMRHIERRADKK